MNQQTLVHRGLQLAFIVAISMATLLLPTEVSRGGPPPSESQGQPDKVAYIIRDRIAKIEAALAVQTLAGDSSSAAMSELSGSALAVTVDGQLELTFHAAGPVGDGEQADLTALGAGIVTSSADLAWPAGATPPGLGFIQAVIQHDQVEAAAGLPWVVAVTPAEDNPPDVGAFLSEGVALHNADEAQTAGFDGTGVTVGAISDGVTNIAAAQATGDLPAVTVFDAGAGNEGTAMLEIVHDMAPGAALQYDATGAGVGPHVASMLNLATNGSTVITEDIPFDAEPAFQKGLAATAGDALAVSGVSVHSSAGNLGNAHAGRVTATGTGANPDGAAGPFAGCANQPDNVVAIAPGGDTTFDVATGAMAGGTLNVTLQWSEPRAIFPTAGQGGFTDLNLYVMNQAVTTCLAQSTAVQANGAGDTIEQVSVAVAANTTVKIVVDVQGTSSAVAAPLLDLRWRGLGAVDATTRAGSLNPDSNYTDLATSSAAANAGASQDPTTVPIEPFSAGGPVQLITTTRCPDATPAPCTGVAGAGGRTVNAPTWTAADGVSISGAGGFGNAAGNCPAVTQGDCQFFGTSAAAPHAAGVDAIVRQAIGLTSPVAVINDRLASSATDRGPPGVDTVWGAGVLNALAAASEEADLRLIKDCKPDQPLLVGDTATCTIIVDNLGPSDARNVVVTDTHVSDAPFTITSATFSPPPASPCTIAGGVVTCNLGTEPAAGRTTITIQVTSNEGGDINDVACVTSDTPDPETNNNCSEDSVTVREEADLRLTKDCKPDQPLLAGGTATCTIFVDNLGPSDAQNVVVTDTHLSAAAFTITSATFDPPPSSPCIIAGGVVTCNLGTEPAGARTTITIQLTSNEGGDISDVACVFSDTPDPDTGNNCDEDSLSVTAVANLGVTKSDSEDPLVSGTTLTYTLTVTNSGPSTAINVVVKDFLPAGVAIQSAGATGGGSCLFGVPGDSERPTICTFDSIAPSGSEVMTIVVTVLPGAHQVLHNDARVKSDTLDLDNSNDVDSESTAVQVADIEMSKTSPADSSKPSKEVTYTLRVTNHGPGNAANVVVTDDLPLRGPDRVVVFPGSDGNACTRAPGSTLLTCNMGTIAAGTSKFVTVVVIFKGNRGIVSNTAEATTTTFDFDLANNTSTKLVLVGQPPKP